MLNSINPGYKTPVFSAIKVEPELHSYEKFGQKEIKGNMYRTFYENKAIYGDDKVIKPNKSKRMPFYYIFAKQPAEPCSPEYYAEVAKEENLAITLKEQYKNIGLNAGYMPDWEAKRELKTPGYFTDQSGV